MISAGCRTFELSRTSGASAPSVAVAAPTPAEAPKQDADWAGIVGECGENATTLDACNGVRAWLDKANQEMRTFVQVNAVTAVTNKPEYNRKLTALRTRIAEATALLAKAEPALGHLAYVQTKGSCGENAPTPESCDALRTWFNGVAAAKRNQQALYASLPGAPPVPGERRLPGNIGQSPAAPPVPGEQFLGDAQATLTAAQPTLMKLREARDWPNLDPRPCGLAVGPTGNDVRQACALVRQFLTAYPSTSHATELHAVLDPADQRATALDAKEQAAIKARADEAVRQQEAARAAEKARQHPRCISACRMQCANSLRFDECFAGCSGLCP